MVRYVKRRKRAWVYKLKDGKGQCWDESDIGHWGNLQSGKEATTFGILSDENAPSTFFFLLR